MPAAVGNAYNLYSSWSFGQSSEPLPELRNFILDRSNLSSIGEFSVQAVEARRKINCSGLPIELTSDHIEGPGSFNNYYSVATSLGADVQLWAQKQLAVWVDDHRQVSPSRAVTRLVFAALGGEIEAGHHNALTSGLKSLCDSDCSSISSLACDVDIDLVDSQACTGPCGHVNSTLTSTETLTSEGVPAFSPQPRNLSPISVYMAAACTIFGISVFGFQPMFTPGIKDPNSPYVLPQSWSDWQVLFGVISTEAFANPPQLFPGLSSMTPFSIGVKQI